MKRLNDIREIFFPMNFREKYSYLGSVPYNDKKTMLHALVYAMDAEAKPWWCPRWFLRFLHVFGNDKSIVRVNNRFLHNLYRKITKGIMIWDYKYKWTDYDLRISISAPKHLQDLADAIERDTYNMGFRKDLIQRIKEHDPGFNQTYLGAIELKQILVKLEGDGEDNA